MRGRRAGGGRVGVSQSVLVGVKRQRRIQLALLNTPAAAYRQGNEQRARARECAAGARTHLQLGEHGLVLCQRLRLERRRVDLCRMQRGRQ
jgi:hypothetical protein